MTLPKIDRDYLVDLLIELLNIPSPSGYTDGIVHRVGTELESLNIPFEMTRRGAIRATLKSKRSRSTARRAVVAHLDTNGAMVRGIKDNGRLALAPIGSWSSRFAEGARVTIFTGEGRSRRGTILPLLASGHTYNTGVDEQPVNWDQLEIRIDERCHSKDDVLAHGINIGNFVGIDPFPEVNQNGFINSRFLDNKAGVAVVLAAARALMESGERLPGDLALLFTIFEEVGSGASSILHGDISEMVSIDNSTIAPIQNSHEYGVTIAMMDSSGPFDYHLTQKLIRLCTDNDIPFSRDVFRYYRCDSASAIEAGNDIRSGLICFALDSSHGYERTHLDSLVALCELTAAYFLSPPTFTRDKKDLAPFAGFPNQPAKDQVLVREAPEGFLLQTTEEDQADAESETHNHSPPATRNGEVRKRPTRRPK